MTSKDLKLMMVVLVGILFIVIGSSLPLLSVHQMAVLAQLEKSYWTIGAPLPTPRSEIAGTVLDDKIYIVGALIVAAAVLLQ